MKSGRFSKFRGFPAGRSWAIVGGLIALASAWIWPLRGMAAELFAAHMFQHLLVMNVAALLIALAWLPHHQRGREPAAAAPRRWQIAARGWPALFAVSTVQLAALWIWHMPSVFAAAHHSAVLQGLMQVSLFAVALLFWKAVLGGGGREVWPSIFALLMTAKVFCLLGAAFVFSRRTLYAAHGNPEIWGLSALKDQQLAGLLMVSSCALIYVAAAIALFARWLITVEMLRRGPNQLTGEADAALVAK